MAHPVPPNVRKALRLVLVVAGLLVSSAAYAQEISTEFDESVDFTKFKTFAIREGQLRSPSPALNSELTKKKIEAAIEKALIAKGLTKVVGQSPSDLNLFYSLGSLRQVETEAYPAGWRGRGTRVVRTPNTQGNLVIDLRDPRTRSLVWRGIATEEEPNPAKVAEKLDEMVRKVIERYPPKK